MGSRRIILKRILSFCGILGLIITTSKQSHSAICFLPDCAIGSAAPQSVSASKECLIQGYQKISEANCHINSAYDYCPANPAYVKCNNTAWCLDNGYAKTICNTPEYLSEQCPNGEPYYKSCEADYAKACKGENPLYVNTCASGWQLDPAGLCSYSGSWGTCCNTCSGFDYKDTTIPAGYVKDTSCTACGNVIKYKIKANPCSGYTTCPKNPQTGTATCLSGTTTMYKECCPNSCTLATCPIGTTCSLETCSGKYCQTGCQSGYAMQNGSCCNTCPGYDYTTIPAGYVADGAACTACGNVAKYKIKPAACTGYITCPKNPQTGTATCLSGTTTMYKECCPYSCSLASCPANTICSQESCSGKYCATGCATGYTMSGGSCCNTCSGYDYTTIPSGYIANGAACTACGNVSKYKITTNPCTGYITCTTPQTGTATCFSGSTTKYKECCPNSCTLASCPTGTICTQESCSNKYCATGCATNYIDFCTAPITNCTTLGYTQTSCSGDKLVCPYDTTKYYCF